MKYRKSIKAENGKVTQVLEYSSGVKIEIPLDKQGQVRWFDDEKLRRKIS